MDVGNTGTTEIYRGTQNAVDTKSRAYEAARDRGDTIEAAHAILQKINLQSMSSLTRETNKANHDTLEANFLQNIARWVSDEELSPEDIVQNMLQMFGTSDSTNDAELDAFLQDKVSLDLNGFEETLKSDRDGLDKLLEREVKLSSTHSNTQALVLKDLLHQHNVLLTFIGELTDLLKALRSTVNLRS